MIAGVMFPSVGVESAIKVSGQGEPKPMTWTGTPRTPRRMTQPRRRTVGTDYRPNGHLNEFSGSGGHVTRRRLAGVYS
jgi:hypothetical protein